MTATWRTELRRIHDDAWNYDWPSHIAKLNARYALTGMDAFGTAVKGLPPVWFNGDVEAIVPGRWTFVLSLNPHQAPDGYYEPTYTCEGYWDLWLNHNRRRWNWRFFPPLVRVASLALGDDVPPDQEREYATSRMVFGELCPYASRRFTLPPDVVRRLAEDDVGFRTAARVSDLLLHEACPGLMIVNGAAAVRSFEAVYRDKLEWTEVAYPSVGQPSRTLRHREGVLNLDGRAVPALGFNFLRRPSTHNSWAEIDDLGRRAHAFVRDKLRDLLAPKR